MEELLTQKEILAALKDSGNEVSRGKLAHYVMLGYVPIMRTRSKKTFYHFSAVMRALGFTSEDVRKYNPTDISDEDKAELEVFLSEPMTANQKISVVKDFWAAKQGKVKYQKEINAVIPMEEAKSVIEVSINNFKTKMYTIPSKIKSLFPSTSGAMVEKMHELIDESFSEFNKGL